MAGKLRVHDWHQFQHYKERNPSWIKLHKGLLDNYKYQRLPVDSRALAPMIWLLASESKDGSLDYDLEKIAFRLRMSALELEAAIVPLISGGFLELEHDASAPLAEPERESSLEKETEREKEVETEKDSAPSAALVVKRETSNTKSKGTRLAVDAEPDEQDIRYAHEDYGWAAERIALEWSNIRDWSQSSRNGVKRDWRAAWRTWVRRREAEQPTGGRVSERRAGIVAGVRGELAGQADVVGSVRGATEPDRDGTGELGGVVANLGTPDHPSEPGSVYDGDGQVVRLVADGGDRGGRAGRDGAVSRDVGGPAGGPVIDGDRSDDSNAPVPQSPEASGYPQADRGGLGATPEHSVYGPIIPEGDPLDIPDFLRRKAS